MADKDEIKDEESKDVKPKPKTIINFVLVGKKARFAAIVVDKKGEIMKVEATGEDALIALKKFVKSL